MDKIFIEKKSAKRVYDLKNINFACKCDLLIRLVVIAQNIKNYYLNKFPSQYFGAQF